MKYFAILTIALFALGQLGAIPLGNNITLYLHDIALVCFAAFVILTKRLKTNATLLGPPIALFISISIVSLLLNSHRFTLGELGISSLYLWRWILYSTLYVIALEPLISSRLWLTLTYWMGVVVASLGFVQYIYYPYLRNLSYLGWDPHLYRLFSTFLDPNYVSLFFVLTFFLGLYVSSYKWRWLYGAGQMLTLAALFLTYSRSGYVALIVGACVYAIFMKKVRVMLLFLGVFVAILFFLPKKDGEGVKLWRTASSVARVDNWQRGFGLIKESPIIGFGFNTLRYVEEKNGWTDPKSIIPSKAGAGLDDSFQFLWATTGIVGLLSYLWLLVNMGKLFIRTLFNYNTRVLGVVGISGLVATIVHSQFVNSLLYPQILMWWWILVGSTEKLLTTDTSRVEQSWFGFPLHQKKQSRVRSRRHLKP